MVTFSSSMVWSPPPLGQTSQWETSSCRFEGFLRSSSAHFRCFLLFSTCLVIFCLVFYSPTEALLCDSDCLTHSTVPQHTVMYRQLCQVCTGRFRSSARRSRPHFHLHCPNLFNFPCPLSYTFLLHFHLKFFQKCVFYLKTGYARRRFWTHFHPLVVS